ncbi:DUF4148 domain-containing protein [Herminiimonas arsenitoxidans]|uniref:DUF4148 domain-containing protein n=1 Tax=Herminiimonas arsenitoxidans TaxID=1809410 RepID=UPI0009705C2A|nr:DUF4148 domain-containing protein [Herminiimonas arsenitoxidans]
MNSPHKKLIAVIAISIASGTAFAHTHTANTNALQLAQAEESNYPILPSFASTKTRAEVKAELQQAREKGLLATTDSDYPKLPVVTSSKTRAQVKAELEQSKASDEGKRLDKEQYSG